MPRCNKVIIRHKITFLWTLLGCYVTNLFINQFVLSWGYHHFHATPKTSTHLRILHEWTLHAKRRKPPSKVYGREVFPSCFQHLLYHTDKKQSIVLEQQLGPVLWNRVNFDKASAVWAQNYNFSHLSLLCGLSVYLTTITHKPFARENQTKKHLHQYPDMVGIVKVSISNLTSFFTLFCREFDADQLKPHLHLWYNNIGCCIVFRIWECLSVAKTFDEAETKHRFLNQMKWHEWPLFFTTVSELLADKFYGNDWYVSEFSVAGQNFSIHSNFFQIYSFSPGFHR